MDSDAARRRIRENLPQLVERLNRVLRGEGLDDIRDILERIDRTGQVPNWFDILRDEHRLINKDGKTAGSVIEKLFVGVIERSLFAGEDVRLSNNPPKGVDIPELELGVKSPSTNFCTSEPFFSAYERILGNEYDAVVLLTNYQEAKKKEPYILQIIDKQYLRGSEIADKNLCLLCWKLRREYNDNVILQRMLRFVAYVNQSDWEAKSLLCLLNADMSDVEAIDELISRIERKYIHDNRKRGENGQEPIPTDSLDRIKRITEVSPRDQGIVSALDDWVLLNQQENARAPSEHEWRRFLRSPLDGKIGMSFALQWRYNFGSIFDEAD
jgi:hypothetical protein